MGAYVSQFADGTDTVASRTQPNKPGWIPAHADATKLSTWETERLWQRFQQLGSDTKGRVHQDVLDRPPASQDIFVRNILSHLRMDGEYIEFQTYLMAMAWAQTASVDDKITATFSLINGGERVDKDLLHRVLRRVYPDDTDESITKLTECFMNQMDRKKRGYIEEADFVSWVQKLPEDSLASILDFSIIPKELQPPPPPTPPPPRVASDAQLREVARLCQKKDWPRLANRLGFTSKDVTAFKKKSPKDPQVQVYSMLVAWRSRDGDQASVEALQTALRESRMQDIANKIPPD